MGGQNEKKKTEQNMFKWMTTKPPTPKNRYSKDELVGFGFGSWSPKSIQILSKDGFENAFQWIIYTPVSIFPVVCTRSHISFAGFMEKGVKEHCFFLGISVIIQMSCQVPRCTCRGRAPCDDALKCDLGAPGCCGVLDRLLEPRALGRLVIGRMPYKPTGRFKNLLRQIRVVDSFGWTRVLPLIRSIIYLQTLLLYLDSHKGCCRPTFLPGSAFLALANFALFPPAPVGVAVHIHGLVLHQDGRDVNLQAGRRPTRLCLPSLQEGADGGSGRWGKPGRLRRALGPRFPRG